MRIIEAFYRLKNTQNNEALLDPKSLFSGRSSMRPSDVHLLSSWYHKSTFNGFEVQTSAFFGAFLFEFASRCSKLGGKTYYSSAFVNSIPYNAAIGPLKNENVSSFDRDTQFSGVGEHLYLFAVDCDAVGHTEQLLSRGCEASVTLILVTQPRNLEHTLGKYISIFKNYFSEPAIVQRTFSKTTHFDAASWLIIEGIK